MGFGSDAITIERGRRGEGGENGGKLKPVRHPAIVAKNTDAETVGAERAVSFQNMRTQTRWTGMSC